MGKIKWTPLSKKEDFYSRLKMVYITDADYVHAKRVGKDLKIRYLAEYHDLHVQGNTLLFSYYLRTYMSWAWSYSLAFGTRISMASSFKKG